MLLKPELSILLLVDIQEKSINAIHQHEQLIFNCKELILMAKAFEVPIMASEHCPEKNGSTLRILKQILPKNVFFEKNAFSCLSKIENKISDHQQIVLAGTETHVCLLQTAIELLGINKQVFVVADATESKFTEDKKFSLKRMQQLGIQIVTKQMVLFEWSESALNPRFRELSDQMLK